MSPLFVLVLVIGVYVLIALYVKHDNKKASDSESIFQYKHNKENVYVEYRQWKLVWGLLIDSQKEINKIIDEWNEKGYTCTGIQKNSLPSSILKIIMIIIITILTLGFVNLYIGPSLLFRKIA